MRLRPVMPAGQSVDSINVKRTDENETAVYRVEFMTQTCAYNYPLLAVVPGQVSSQFYRPMREGDLIMDQ